VAGFAAVARAPARRWPSVAPGRGPPARAAAHRL